MKSWAAVVMLCVAPILIARQQQPSPPRPGWPCNARIDLSYFQVAEGTGGHLLLLGPEEIGDSAALLTTFNTHPQTILRLAGTLNPGLHEFPVPIDPSVDSVAFSVSIQCLQVVEVLRPSGVTATGEDVTAYSNFRAQRLVVSKKPEPGIWKVRVSGSGLMGVVAQARSAIGIGRLQFTSAASPAPAAVPSPGIEQVVMIRVSGGAAISAAALVDGTLSPIAPLRLEPDGIDGLYRARFTPGVQGFRILVTGADSNGVVFQRMSAALISPMR